MGPKRSLNFCGSLALSELVESVEIREKDGRLFELKNRCKK